MGSLATGTATLTSTDTPDSAVTVTPSISTITDNQPLTVAVTVVGIAGQATPTGSVTLASGSSYTVLTALAGGGSSNIFIEPGIAAPPEQIR